MQIVAGSLALGRADWRALERNGFVVLDRYAPESYYEA